MNEKFIRGKNDIRHNKVSIYLVQNGYSSSKQVSSKSLLDIYVQGPDNQSIIQSIDQISVSSSCV